MDGSDDATVHLGSACPGGQVARSRGFVGDLETRSVIGTPSGTKMRPHRREWRGLEEVGHSCTPAQIGTIVRSVNLDVTVT